MGWFEANVKLYILSVPIFFILSGRVLTVSILKSGNMRQLASAIIRRPFRLLVPMLSMAFIDMLFLHRNQPTFVLKIVLDHLWFMFDGAEIPSTGTWVEWTLSNGLLLADLAQNGYMDRYRSWKYSHYINTLWFIGSACLVFRSPILNIADPVDQAVRAHLYSHGNMGVNMHYSVENAMIFLFCFSIMLSIETSVWLQWVFSRSPLVFLGRISFPLYLMHPYAAKYLDMVNNYLREVIKNYVLLTACIFVVSTAIVCLCSYLLIPVIDTPSIYIGRWVEQSVVTEPWSWTAIKLWAIGLPQKIKADIKKRLRSLHTSVRGVVHAVQHPKLCRSH
ncbi:hypothetical protein BSLG_002303 [Batrachochytrium salamandrivorans]|nr:hypothetical protein BSLG_002303 [Batrachochytrium salamandrivorans]